MDLTITPPEGYRKTRMRWLWGLAGCDVCGGSGEYLVNDHAERNGQPWDPEDGPLLYPQPCDCLWAPEPEITRAVDEQNLALRNATAIVSASSTCAGTTSSQSTPDVAIDCQKSGLVSRYR